MYRAILIVCVAFALATTLAPLACAQASPAPIKISVDATQAPQKILHAHAQIPGTARPAHIELPRMDSRRTYARRADHQVAGMKFTAGGKDDSLAARSGRNVLRSTLTSRRESNTLDVDLDFLLVRARARFFRGRLRDRLPRRAELEPGPALSAGLCRAKD